MADYIYLLESRLSQAQQRALQAVREIARAKGLTVFLAGGAVRDLTSGSPVRDLDVAIQGNALKIRKDLEKAGAVITGEMDALQALFLRFAGGVRMEVSSTVSIEFPKPGKPVVKAATILEDLRCRDFTANAMALSLNEGSYGLLMDPLNGVADIENREIRLVSNYGFIEDPVRMIRAQRFAARLGWQLEEKTQARYETGKAEGYISAMSEFQRGYELEEIFHEDDPLRVMRRLEQEGWMEVLSPGWNSSKVNVAELEKLKDTQAQLQLRAIEADASTAQFPLLTAKLNPKEIASLKSSFPRQGFVAEIEHLDAEAKQFAGELGGKQAAVPSEAWKMIVSARPEVVLWVGYSSKTPTVQNRLKSFYTEWPQARQKIPYTLMQEMRIVPELPGYDELVEKLFFELMDGKLTTTEELKSYLEPYSPPAPPPQVSVRKARGGRKEGKGRGRKKVEAEPIATEELGEELAATSEAEGLRQAEAEEEQPEQAPQATAPNTAQAAKLMRPAPVASPERRPKGEGAPRPGKSKAAPVKPEQKKPVPPQKKAAKVAIKKPVAAKPSAKKNNHAKGKGPAAPVRGKTSRPVKTTAKKSAAKSAGKSVPQKKTKVAARAKPAPKKSKPAPKSKPKKRR